MTCREVHLLLEDALADGFDLDQQFGKIAEHTADCEACGRWMEAQRGLRASLRAVRDSSPEIPASLDAAVLAGYRSETAKSSVSLNPQPRWAGRLNPLTALAWTAAIVAAMLLARTEFSVIFPREEATWNQGRTPQARTSHQEPKQADRGEVAAVAQASLSNKARHSIIAERTPPLSSVERASSLPSEFTGLMYCDVLSCGGEMEVIRVQLPSPEAAVEPAWTATNGVHAADFLVGPDGIARGFRIVE